MSGTTSEYAMKCVRCGSCKALCPTYDYDARESLSARGRLMLLYALESGDLEPGPVLMDRVFSCALCGMCDATCPAGLEITESIYRARNLLRPEDGERKRLRAAARFSLKRPLLSFRAVKLLRPLLPYLIRKGLVPYGITLPEEPLRNGGNIFQPEKSRGRVAVFTGCSVNFLLPHLGEALIKVLIGLGYEVVLPPGEVCCGAPLRALGLEKEAVSLARKNLEIFGKLRAEAVLSLCPTCTLALKVQYPRLIGEGVKEAMDVSQFLAGKIGPYAASALGEKPLVEGKAVYHDPCHLAYGLGVRKEPREILRSLGLQTIEPPGGGGCCGFSLSLTHKDIAEGLLQKRLAAYREAETVVTSCPGCMLQLERGGKKVLHLIEVLDRAMEAAEAAGGRRPGAAEAGLAGR
jgi:glycolate oxidase iron-sulfur subunit